jgi:hypothetical protein
MENSTSPADLSAAQAQPTTQAQLDQFKADLLTEVRNLLKGYVAYGATNPVPTNALPALEKDPEQLANWTSFIDARVKLALGTTKTPATDAGSGTTPVSTPTTPAPVTTSPGELLTDTALTGGFTVKGAESKSQYVNVVAGTYSATINVVSVTDGGVGVALVDPANSRPLDWKKLGVGVQKVNLVAPSSGRVYFSVIANNGTAVIAKGASLLKA